MSTQRVECISAARNWVTVGTELSSKVTCDGRYASRGDCRRPPACDATLERVCDRTYAEYGIIRTAYETTRSSLSSQTGALDGSSLDDQRAFPESVRNRVGGALWEAQTGSKAAFAKPLKGFGGAGVLEVVDDFDGDTYRAVYTVKFARAVYVLHAFQKKSTRGIATAQRDLDLIKRRLALARKDHDQWNDAE